MEDLLPDGLLPVGTAGGIPWPMDWLMRIGAGKRASASDTSSSAEKAFVSCPMAVRGGDGMREIGR